MSGEAITESLELVAERCGDPAPLVYERLFAAHPDMAQLFVRDSDGSIKGHMLFQVIEALLDFVGQRNFGPALMRIEIVNHENLGVPRAVFPVFFTAMRDTFKDVLGDAWTPAIDAAWRDMLDEIEATLAGA